MGLIYDIQANFLLDTLRLQKPFPQNASFSIRSDEPLGAQLSNVTATVFVLDQYCLGLSDSADDFTARSKIDRRKLCDLKSQPSLSNRVNQLRHSVE